MHRVVKKLVAFIFVISGFAPALQGQFRASVETSGIISSSANTPFWFQSNRHGIYSRHGSQFLSRVQFHGNTDLSDHFSILYGADAIARPGKASTLSFNRGYLKIQGYGFELAAGRFYHTSPFYDEWLSLGSLGVSGNASPVPQIRLGLPEWTPLPLTNKFVHIRAHLAHGWLGSRRYTESVLLHEKAMYLRFGRGSQFNAYGGLSHFAVWGGKNHPRYDDIPTNFQDFVNVFFSLKGDRSTPGPEQSHALGDHLGTWDFGFFLERDDYKLHAYRQFIYEDYTNLFFKSYMDALTGISIRFSEELNIPFSRFIYEYLYTKSQAGPRESRGDRIGDGRGPYRYNENYYNHNLYRTGWVYNMRTIGNPMFTPSETNLGVLNNRIIAHHIGFVSEAGPVALTGKATFSRNYGKRCDNRVPDIGEGELFGIECVDEVITVRERSLDQWSFLLGVETPVPLTNTGQMAFIFQIAYDNGRLLGDQWGALAGIRWEL